MSRSARAALLVFAATLGFDLPAPPVPVHAVWADLALAFALGATLLSLVRGGARPPRARAALVAALVYLGWTSIAAASSPGAAATRIGWALGVSALVGVFVTTATWTQGEDGAAMRDRVMRAWIGGALAIGLVGLGTGLLAQAGFVLPWLHNGSGELGLVFRPAGLQRVGLLAELSLVPFIIVLADGERLLGRRARVGALSVLGLVLCAGLTRTLLAAALGVVLLHMRRGRLRVAAIAGLIAAVMAALRFDIHGGGVQGIRWRIAASALATFRAHPLLGVGPAAEIARAGWPGPLDRAASWDAHMTVLDIGARAGLPAVIAFCALFVFALRRVRHEVTDPLRAALAIGLCCTALDAFCVDVEDFRHVWLLLGLCAGYHDISSPAGTRSEPGEHRDEEPVQG